MEPAKTIIAKLGGEAAVSAIAGCGRTSPYRWQYPIDKGGTGGQIPAKHIPALLAHAKVHKIALAAAEFYPDTSQAAPAEGAAA